MRSLHYAAAAVALLLVAASDDGPKPFVPTEAYESREVRGWTVRVNRRLLDEEAELGRAALALLEQKLGEVVEAIPEKSLARLRRISIWLGVDDGHAPCAEYHPSRKWLVDNGYNPDKAKCVEIGNARRFLEWSKAQPSMILHELAHGYHDQVFGFDQPEIMAAHARVKKAGLYDQVRDAAGRQARHYALTNPQEYFAEFTESFFGRNDFAPFARAELKAADPETAELIERMWRLPPDD